MGVRTIKRPGQSSENVQPARKLMMYFIDDVVKGIDPVEAGWREPETSEDKKFPFVETRENKVRFSLPGLRASARAMDKETRRLLAICTDIEKSTNVMRYAESFADKFSMSKELRGSVVTIGLGRMFETSDFPVSPSRVIEVGFNFSNWFVNVSKCSYSLAFEIARSRYQISWDAFCSLLTEIGDNDKTQADPVILTNVKRVLQWDRAMGILLDSKANTTVEAVALMWFIDILCEINSILQDESYVYVQSTAWKLISSRINRSRIEIMKSMSEITDEIYKATQVDRSLTTDWARVVRLPW